MNGFGDLLGLFLALIFAQALNASASATLAFIHAALFALGDEPAAAAQILHDPAVHHVFIKPAEKTVEGFALAYFDRHTNHPFLGSDFDNGREMPSSHSLAFENSITACDARHRIYQTSEDLSNIFCV
jgi:hypothetical protein